MTASPPASAEPADVTSRAIDPVLEYRRLVADVVAAAKRRDGALAAAAATRAAGEEAIRRDLAAANDAYRIASETVAARELDLLRVDHQAEQVWADLRSLRRRAGDQPAPAAAATGADASALLASAAGRIARARRGDAISGQSLVILPLIGGACATAVALTASGLHWLGLPLSWLFFLAAPFTGLPFAARFVDHREGTRLDTGAVGFTVLGGMLAALLTALTLR